MDSTRTERDSLGDMEVPAEALYGASTARAIRNFPISGLRSDPRLIAATLDIKAAAARVNRDNGSFQALAARFPDAFRGHAPAEVADAIGAAARDIRDHLTDGEHGYYAQFPVDVYQAGAGTSHNMNVNEVVANRAIQLLGGTPGDRELVDPNDHVNMGQSTNDVVPTAIRIAALHAAPELSTALERLADDMDDRARAFGEIVKSGRTHLQDAVPITLGHEFRAWARTVRRSVSRLAGVSDELAEVGIGGNAVGTGINAPAGFAEAMANALAEETGLPLRAGADLVELCQNVDSFSLLSGVMRTLALDLIRIANDLRLLASGPNTGLGEITLPVVQPGSSIMPGKVNPVMAEMLNMVCFQVVGNDSVIALACQAGQLELNVMTPVIAHNLLQSLTILTNGVRAFAAGAVAGITADAGRCRHYLDRSLGLATVLNPVIGYMKAASVAKRAREENRSIRDIVIGDGLMGAEEFDRLIATAVQTPAGRS